jgi:hypothetical protein
MAVAAAKIRCKEQHFRAKVLIADSVSPFVDMTGLRIIPVLKLLWVVRIAPGERDQE